MNNKSMEWDKNTYCSCEVHHSVLRARFKPLWRGREHWWKHSSHKLNGIGAKEYLAYDRRKYWTGFKKRSKHSETPKLTVRLELGSTADKEPKMDALLQKNDISNLWARVQYHSLQPMLGSGQSRHEIGGILRHHAIGCTRLTRYTKPPEIAVHLSRIEEGPPQRNEARNLGIISIKVWNYWFTRANTLHNNENQHNVRISYCYSTFTLARLKAKSMATHMITLFFDHLVVLYGRPVLVFFLFGTRPHFFVNKLGQKTFTTRNLFLVSEFSQ